MSSTITEYERESCTTTRIVPNCLKYQFTPEFNIKLSDKCCDEFKKSSFYEYEESTKRTDCFTGQRRAEGGNREKLKCISVGKNGNHFNILAPITDDWVEWFISKYEIKLCELYLPPFNFKRTGCMGCPFNKQIQKDLDILKQYANTTFIQCCSIWNPIYAEYKRINYRIKNKE